MQLFYYWQSWRTCKSNTKVILSRSFKWFGSGVILPMLLWAVLGFMGDTANAGFKIEDGILLDGNGIPFVMRGVNHSHVWYPNKTQKAISDMAVVGVNAVRVILGSGHQWGPTPALQVADIIEQLKDHKMIAVLEVHDCTGYGENDKAAHLSTAVDYWLNLQDVLKGEEDYVIINIANEPLGDDVATTTWADIHMRAIDRLRKAGLNHTLMVDAANWGQDWEQIMLNDAPQVFSSDPQRNIVFSVHMYEVYNTYSIIDDYISTFVNKLKLPLVIGEFGPDHQGEDVDETSIMELADRYRIGYLGWSWSGSGNREQARNFDIIIDFKLSDLSTWGDFLINSINGIMNSAEPASVFGKDPMDTTGNLTSPTTSDAKDSTGFVGCGDTTQTFR